MSALIKYVDGGFNLSADDWQIAPRDAAPQTLPAGNWLYPLAVWQAHEKTIRAQNKRFGLWLAAETLPADLSKLKVQDFAAIALSFPKFADGRAYSLARLLRERLVYTGEIRAVGDVLPDQLLYMWRTGFTAWALREDQNADAALALLKNAAGQHMLRHAYQGAIIPPAPLFRRNATQTPLPNQTP
ncbi:hypothetical protein AGMMS49545_01780 [Betaproteobacteria bacterium]|nr:hypothetical protein AGMMS49545_01780 [Betaproteobacteria bacterium]GHU43716.1 hypothetical protein AGMMS50289_10610 [Betaproteobacteria bacterium]